MTTRQLRMADRIIAVSPGLKEQVAKANPRVTFLPNGAPSELATLKRPADSPPYVMFLGELAPWQGLQTVLTATLSPGWPSDLKLLIVGDGQDVGLVSAAASERVQHLGRLPRQEALQYLAGAAATFSPQTAKMSRNRLGVTPLKVAESLLLGVPVVASDLPGQADIVRHVQGCGVFRPDDDEALVRALNDVLSSAPSRDVIAKRAAKLVSWEAIAEHTLVACESALKISSARAADWDGN